MYFEVLYKNVPHQYSMEYRNNQTTSTKCQYQAAHSNPMICCWELINFLNRKRDTKRKIDPTITCIPWKPVAIKKVDPKAESAMQNGASLYSNPWNSVNTIPSRMVNISEFLALLKFLLSISW